MKISLFRFAVLLLAAITLYSCKKEQSDSVSTSKENEKISEVQNPVVENSRMVFSSHDAFYKFVDAIDNNDPAIGEKLRRIQGFTSLYDRIKSYDLSENELPASLNNYLEFGLPESFQRVLNADGEVIIGDQLVWYYNSYKYYINKAESGKLQVVKENPDVTDVRKTKVGKELAPVNIKSTDQARVWMGLTNGPDARHQREFWQYAPAAGNRKYVHEIQAYTDTYFDGVFYQWNSRVILRIKMEWRGKRWQPAGETRQISYNLTSSNVFYGPPFGYLIPANTTFTGNVTQSGDVSRMVAQAAGSGTFGSGNGWSIELSGTIYQHVVGDVQSNEWYNTGYPLW